MVFVANRIGSRATCCFDRETGSSGLEFSRESVQQLAGKVVGARSAGPGVFFPACVTISERNLARTRQFPDRCDLQLPRRWQALAGCLFCSCRWQSLAGCLAGCLFMFQLPGLQHCVSSPRNAKWKSSDNQNRRFPARPGPDLKTRSGGPLDWQVRAHVSRRQVRAPESRRRSSLRPLAALECGVMQRRGTVLYHSGGQRSGFTKIQKGPLGS